MKQKFHQIFSAAIISLSLLASFGAAATLVSPGPALAACSSGTYTLQNGVECGAPSSASQKGLFGTDPAHPGNLFIKIADLLIFIVGAISVIMIIVGGLRYVLSAGNASGVTGAKDTILYAVIGVIIAGLAFAIVNFVIGKIGG